MQVSLNWIKKYVDIPDSITPKQIAYDLSLRTVEVESVEYTKEKYHDIVVGKILQLKEHPNADKLKICITDIGEKESVQIVCGGSNLYEGEMVVVSKPGAEVYWHGEGKLVKITKTKMRGEDSYGMICAASEVFLDKFFPASDEREIVDLSNIDCKVGQNIVDVINMDDVVLEIDNKSLTNRPDLWGHYGIARELSTIFKLPLNPLPTFEIPKNLPEYQIDIQDCDKCQRYAAIEIENVFSKSSPMWMQASLVSAGMRPINAIVDITNYVMLAVGQPTHAFDRTHVDGKKIIVRNAKKGEQLLLLDDNTIALTEDDLVICDLKSPLALAGIKGGKKDSILPETTGVLLEVANFTASTIRQSQKRFDEKTDASIRYEKNIDTNRVDEGIELALHLFKEIFPECRIVSYGDCYPKKTQRSIIDVPQQFLNIRLGKCLSSNTIIEILNSLGYEVSYQDEVYHVIAPTWRSTGDVSIKDDVLGDIARILSYQSFEATPLTISIDNAINQKQVTLERNIRQYLAFRCGFNEVYTYPWIDIKYISAAKIDLENAIKLATPPAPELKNLRTSLVPGLLEAIAKNLRYYDNFKIFEVAQVFNQGIYHETNEQESLPIHKKLISGAIVGKNAKEIFYELKGVIENLSSWNHMEAISLQKKERPTWADVNAYLSIMLNDEEIGSISLVSSSCMAACKIKRTNVAIFEINFDKLIPFPSRTNKYIKLPTYPLVEKDLSIIVSEEVTWLDILNAISSMTKEVIFIEEYRGNQIENGMKSIVFRVKIGKDDSTMDSDEINSTMQQIIKKLNKNCNAKLREE